MKAFAELLDRLCLRIILHPRQIPIGAGRSRPWALFKLVTGALRVGVSARLAKTALAEWSGTPLADIEDAFVRNHTVDSFGPVRQVEPKLVFEVAFDSVHRSSRHKSGVAMRFPRIHRIRWDKPAAEADRLDTLVGMIVD